MERLVRFLAVLCSEASSIAQPDFKEAAHQAVESLLSLLLENSQAKDKTVRFRSCQVLNHVLHAMPADAEMSEELTDDLLNRLEPRLNDKVSTVRAQAVRALARLPQPNEVRLN